MGDSWRAIEDSHIKGRPFRRIGILKPKNDFQSIHVNGELVGYGCTPKCTSLILSLAGIDNCDSFSYIPFVVRSVRETDKQGLKINTKDVVCSMGCDKYIERFDKDTG